MLKPISRLRSICKGDLNHNTTNPTYSTYYNNYNNHGTSYTMILSRIRKQVLHSIPVLSIFVLLGIIGYAIISPNNLVNLLSNVDGEVYAADSTSNTSSLIIDNGELTNSNNTITEGNITYSSHTVQVVANNIEGYSLKITGPTNLTGSTTITGAGNKTPANMANNTWGYAWGAETTANANMAYNSFTGADQTLASSSSATSANFANKLVFAVKFGDNAVSGHYKANVKLNLTVTPKTVTTNYSVNYNMNEGTGGPSNTSGPISGSSYTYTIPSTKPTKLGYEFMGWSDNNSTEVKYSSGSSVTLTLANPSIALYAVWKGVIWDTITKMQDMTADICKSAADGAVKVLEDERDQNNYTIKKLTDGNCWMTSNLILDLSVTDLSTNDSDNANYTKGTATKVTTTSNWSAINTVAQWTPQVAVNSQNPGDKKGYQSQYGYYYSWCAATAGTCSETTSNNVNVSGSICPKNWQLPQAKSDSWANNDFLQLMRTTNYNGWDGSTKITFSTSNFINSYVAAKELRTTNVVPAYLYLGGSDWYRAGYVGSSGLSYPGSDAYYWSRTSRTDTLAYALHYASDNDRLTPAANTNRILGAPVRCIAYSS